MYTKEELLKWHDDEYCLKEVNKNGFNLKHIKIKPKRCV